MDGSHHKEHAVTYAIAEPCIDVKDKACVEECPVDCIYEGPRMLYIQPDECVDCGACEPVCPVEAVFYEDDLPEQWQPFRAVNQEVFRRRLHRGCAAGRPLLRDGVSAVIRPAPPTPVLLTPVSPPTPVFPVAPSTPLPERCSRYRSTL
jgi:ferredoxin